MPENLTPEEREIITKMVNELMQNKTEEQRVIIRYLCDYPEDGCCGCGATPLLTDAQYIAKVQEKFTASKIRDTGMLKLGLDKDQVNEIPPVKFEGFVFDKALAKRTANGNWVSSKYQVSWLFFSSEQVYLYEFTFDMTDNSTREHTEEFFYRDITSFSTNYTTEKAYRYKELVDISTNKFQLVVPGTYFSIAMGEDKDDVIQAMRQKLREKKQEI